jgi:hypothetical protein
MIMTLEIDRLAVESLNKVAKCFNTSFLESICLGLAFDKVTVEGSFEYRRVLAGYLFVHLEFGRVRRCSDEEGDKCARCSFQNQFWNPRKRWRFILREAWGNLLLFFGLDK